jgi:hypothetical protein
MWLAETIGFSRWVYVTASVVLHSVNSVLAFCGSMMFLNIISRQGGTETSERTVSCVGIAVAFFSLHPQRTEVLAWPSCFPYVLAGCFSLLSVLCHLYYHHQNPEWTPATGRLMNVWTLTSMMFYFVAVFCKASTITLMVVFVAIDMCVFFVGAKGVAQNPMERIMSVVAVLSNSVLMVIITLIGLRAASTADYGGEHVMAQPVQVTMGGRIMRAAFMLVAYLVNTVVPAAISVRCLVPEDDMYCLTFILSLAAVVPISLYCVYAVLLGKSPTAILCGFPWLVYVGMCHSRRIRTTLLTQMILRRAFPLPRIGGATRANARSRYSVYNPNPIAYLAFVADRYTYVCMMLMGPSALAPILHLVMSKTEGAIGGKANAKLLWPVASAVALAAVAYTST